MEDFAIGQYVILRTYSAGVHIGTLKTRQGREALLENARRIHYWEGAFTLSAIAQEGLGQGSRLSVAVPEMLVTECIEILPCSPKAEAQLKEFKAHES
jgi:hypothetical protein